MCGKSRRRGRRRRRPPTGVVSRASLQTGELVVLETCAKRCLRTCHGLLCNVKMGSNGRVCWCKQLCWSVQWFFVGTPATRLSRNCLVWRINETSCLIAPLEKEHSSSWTSRTAKSTYDYFNFFSYCGLFTSIKGRTIAYCIIPMCKHYDQYWITMFLGDGRWWYCTTQILPGLHAFSQLIGSSNNSRKTGCD